MLKKNNTQPLTHTHTHNQFKDLEYFRQGKKC